MKSGHVSYFICDPYTQSGHPEGSIGSHERGSMVNTGYYSKMSGN